MKSFADNSLILSIVRPMSLYRPNVAALLVNQNGDLLVCERIKVKNAWQFPQGGVDEGEALDEALVREVFEEIGLKAEHYNIVKKKGGYRYEYPEGVRRKKKKDYVGQEQTYYLCEVCADAPEIDIDQDPAEFADSKWISPKRFRAKWLPDFKKEVYRQVMRDFFDADLLE